MTPEDPPGVAMLLGPAITLWSLESTPTPCGVCTLGCGEGLMRKRGGGIERERQSESVCIIWVGVSVCEV